MASEPRSISVRITKPEDILAMRDGCLTFNADSESYNPHVISWSAQAYPKRTMSMVIQHPHKRFPAEVYQPGGIVMTRDVQLLTHPLTEAAKLRDVHRITSAMQFSHVVLRFESQPFQFNRGEGNTSKFVELYFTNSPKDAYMWTQRQPRDTQPVPVQLRRIHECEPCVVKLAVAVTQAMHNTFASPGQGIETVSLALKGQKRPPPARRKRKKPKAKAKTKDTADKRSTPTPTPTTPERKAFSKATTTSTHAPKKTMSGIVGTAAATTRRCRSGKWEEMSLAKAISRSMAKAISLGFKDGVRAVHAAFGPANYSVDDALDLANGLAYATFCLLIAYAFNGLLTPLWPVVTAPLRVMMWLFGNHPFWVTFVFLGVMCADFEVVLKRDRRSRRQKKAKQSGEKAKRTC